MARKNHHPKLFTKHLFHSGCTCPTKLYYKARKEKYPEQTDQWPYIEHIRYNKRQLRRVLELLHPEGINIERGESRHVAAHTAERLKDEHVVLFNASFIHDNLFAHVPALEKDGGRVRIYYLQTKGFDPNRHSMLNRKGKVHTKWRDYIRDFAYLLYVIREEYPDWKLEPYLVLPDKTATTTIDRLDQRLDTGEQLDQEELAKLLAFVPVMDEIERFWNGHESLFEQETGPLKVEDLSFEQTVKQLAEWYVSGEKVHAGIGKKCGKCEFRVAPNQLGAGQKSGFAECWKPVLEDRNGDAHIFDLIGAGNGQLLEDEVFLQQEISIEETISPGEIASSNGRISDTHRRILQIAKAKGQEVPDEIIKPQLVKELNQWEFPLHFLDFEAGNFAVPLRSGRNPYHQVVFQFSCHTLHEDGTLNHHQWLHPGDETYPNYQLVAELMKVPRLQKGTIIHYSGFERSALKRIRNELKRDNETSSEITEQIQWLTQIVEGRKPFFADLGNLLKNYYYNKYMEGSLSVKDVLAAVMSISDELRVRFSEPYTGSNFRNHVWWQRKNGVIQNPYDMLVQVEGSSVGQGAEAMVAYRKLRTGVEQPENVESPLQGLLHYCELDTLAMVMIYLHWQEALSDGHID